MRFPKITTVHTSFRMRLFHVSSYKYSASLANDNLDLTTSAYVLLRTSCKCKLWFGGPIRGDSTWVISISLEPHLCRYNAYACHNMNEIATI